MKVQKLSESFDMTRISPYVLAESALVENGLELSRAEKRAMKKQDKQNERILSKASKVLAKDFEKVCARATFYIDNKYDKGMTQAQWRSWIASEQKRIANIADPGKKAAAEEKFNAQRHNAIVVGSGGQFIRRGFEFFGNRIEKFIPGKNDKITSGYFIEPYKYGGSGSSKIPKAPKPTSSGGSSGGTKKVGKITSTNFKKFQQFAKLTGIQLFDAEKKEVKIDDAQLEQIATYTIKMGSVEMPALEWLEAVKKARPF